MTAVASKLTKAGKPRQRFTHNESTEKQCVACRQWKPYRDYYRCSKARDGYQSRCKGCDALRASSRTDSNGSNPNAEKQSSKVCNLCCGMAHRVEGPSCRRCRLPYAEEPKPELVLRRFTDARGLL